MKRKQLIIEVTKRFENIIKLCDHIAYTKSHIRQVANDACSFLYNEKTNNNNPK